MTRVDKESAAMILFLSGNLNLSGGVFGGYSLKFI